MVDRYEIVKTSKPLQIGRFGKTVLAKEKMDGKLVMLKSVLLKEFLTEDQRIKDLASKEPEMLRKVNSVTHANIVHLYHHFYHDDVLYMVLEYCDGGTLARFLQSRKGSQLEEQQIQSWFCQLSLVVSFVHEQQIIHRGISCDNIFLDNDAKLLKLGSFDVAKTIEDSFQHHEENGYSAAIPVGQTIIGQPKFMAPEMLGAHGYDQKADIWQMGLVLFHMATLKEAIIQPGIDPVGENKKEFEPYSPQLKSLVSRILTAYDNPYDRPSIQSIVSDPFILVAISNYVARGALMAPGPGETVETWEQQNEKHRPYLKQQYWHSLRQSPSEDLWWRAPSHVTELVNHPIQNIVVAVCYNGDIIALRKKSDAPVEAWSGHVNISGFSNPKIMHAAFDCFTSRLYFTTSRNSGVFCASLYDIEQQGLENKPVVAESFIKPSKQYSHFDGLATDVENSLLFTCDETEGTIRVFSTTNRRCLLRIYMGEKRMLPYKCVIRRLPSDHERANEQVVLLATSDRKNSQILLFRLAINIRSASVEPDVRSQFVASISSGRNGDQVSKPHGLFFDDAGNLIVADDGNDRIQGFSAQCSPENKYLQCAPDRFNKAIGTLSLGTTMSSLLVTVDNTLSSSDRCPFLLVGLYGSTPHIGMKGIMCFNVSA